MEQYQQRVVEEKTELDSKISKLVDFITTGKINTVQPDQAKLMRSQLSHMREYSRILEERINLFK